jgi:hypothetical protein
MTCGDNLPKSNCIGGIFRKALRAQTKSISFLQTSFTVRTDFIVVQYLISSSGVPNNRLCCFQGNVVKVICISVNICNVYTDFSSSLSFMRYSAISMLCVLLYWASWNNQPTLFQYFYAYPWLRMAFVFKLLDSHSCDTYRIKENPQNSDAVEKCACSLAPFWESASPSGYQ